jgi:hypothetical protein
MQKKYQVFVSSTYQDLIEERKAVAQAVLKSNCIPAGMEFFGADTEEQWKVITRVIDESDYYILIIAGKYGSEWKGKSYTQREYEYAAKKKKPIISLLHKDIDTLVGSKLERSEKKAEKLEKFRNETKKRLCAFWTSPSELAEECLHALNNLKRNSPRDGWIRATRHNLKTIADNRNKSLLKKVTALEKRVLSLSEELELRKSDLSPKDFQDRLNSRLKEVDTLINAVFETSVEVSKTGKREAFSSEKILQSMSHMGIPVGVGLAIIEGSIEELKVLKRQVSQLTTNHIRRALSNSIFRLDLPEYTDSEIQAWGDSYVRRYGNPEIRIAVLIDIGPDQGDIKPLTFKLLKRRVVPDLIESILGPSNAKAFLKKQKSDDETRIAEEVFRIIKGLNVYRIHYGTLISISKEAATQPPHPWIVSRPFEQNTVGYDKDRASSHAARLKLMLETGDLQEGRYSLKECIHHSCSGILALYGVYMGCGYMAPFYNLQHHCEQLHGGRDSDALNYSQFDNITADLARINGGLVDLIAHMRIIRTHIREAERIEPQVIAKNALDLHRTFCTLAQIYFPNMC